MENSFLFDHPGLENRKFPNESTTATTTSTKERKNTFVQFILHHFKNTLQSICNSMHTHTQQFGFTTNIIPEMGQHWDYLSHRLSSKFESNASSAEVDGSQYTAPQ